MTKASEADGQVWGSLIGAVFGFAVAIATLLSPDKGAQIRVILIGLEVVLGLVLVWFIFPPLKMLLIGLFPKPLLNFISFFATTVFLFILVGLASQQMLYLTGSTRRFSSSLPQVIARSAPTEATAVPAQPTHDPTPIMPPFLEITPTPPLEPSVPPTMPSKENVGTIAFVSNRNGNSEIYTMDENGGSLLNLTQNTAEDISPAWSPDGSEIAFASNRNGNWEIYVIHADGSNHDDPIRLTNNSINDLSPVWSPDGHMIAYTSEYKLYITNADGAGGDPFNLASQTDGAIHSPTWSSDGKRIVYLQEIGGNPQIREFEVERMQDRPLNVDTVLDRNCSPSFASGGSPIVFVNAEREIYRMDADGSNPMLLTYTNAINASPSWSSDGTWIIFASKNSYEDKYDIYRMLGKDGSSLEQLTHDSADKPSDDTEPVWQPPINTHRPAPLFTLLFNFASYLLPSD